MSVPQMSGAMHWRMAEEILAQVGEVDPEPTAEEAQVLGTLALVHATLAASAASYGWHRALPEVTP